MMETRRQIGLAERTLIRNDDINICESKAKDKRKDFPAGVCPAVFGSQRAKPYF